ncbi:MAG: PPC domain-containing DNA-binding protein [Acidimicrobiia bacterium]
MTPSVGEIQAVHLFRLPTGSDLYEEITSYVTERNIRSASLTFLGAVRKASLRYFDQDAKQYLDFTLDEHLEILSGVGNISVLEDQPFLHAHASLGDKAGRAYGGHLNVGTEVFVTEVTLWELTGDPPVREFDETCGLSLWPV